MRYPKTMLILSLLLWIGLPMVMSGTVWHASAALADGGGEDNSGDGDSGGNDDGNDDNSGSGSDNSGSDDDGGGDDNGGSDGGSGTDDGGTDDGGSSSGSNSGSSGASGSTTSDDGTQSSSGGNYGGDGVHLFAADGSVEIVRNGIYERIDARGRVTERRKATAADRSRLSSYRDRIRNPAQRGTAVSIVLVNERNGTVQLIDANGWTETIKGKTYLLIDPNGNTVTRRAATSKDRSRMRAFLGL
ncbi:MAG: hypothetical protein WCC57_10305 [Paracoccaceae bacterium]